MLSKIKRILAGAAAALLLALGGAPAVVSAQAYLEGSACNGANLDLKSAATDDSATCTTATTGTGQKANDLIARVINIFSVIVGVVCVIMIIYGGFRYVTSGGESSNISTAKNTILYAIIGLVIVAMAQFVVKFVLTKATGVNA